jgi:hypothetical protein
MMNRARRLVIVLTVTALLGAVSIPTLAQSPSSSPSAERPLSGRVQDDPDATALDLFTAYSSMLVAGDVAGLDGLLGDGFLIQRTDGSRATKAEYLAHLPALTAFDFADPVETRSGDLLVLALTATAELVVDGQPYRPDPAPMLAVFAWTEAGWKLVAQGNFNLPQ